MSFGTRPDRAEAGFGYIHRAEAIDDHGYQVSQFVEKPDVVTAQSYLADGGYDWNSSMFLFKASRFIEELAEHAPAMLDVVRTAHAMAKLDLDFVRIDYDAFARVPDDSIGYAVMEKTRRAAVIPVSCDWSDIGSWSALWLTGEKDADENFCQDDTLVVHRDAAQDVKKIVEKLEDAGRSEHSLHRVVHRPWGNYDSLEAGARFLVKRIQVKPGASLSLQKHHHRAEHWIVVSGTAEVTCDDNVFLLGENQSTYIPLGSKHRLGNPGKVVLELIEVHRQLSGRRRYRALRRRLRPRLTFLEPQRVIRVMPAGKPGRAMPSANTRTSHALRKIRQHAADLPDACKPVL